MRKHVFLYRNLVKMLKESELKILDHLTLSSEGRGFISQIARRIGMSKGEVSKAVKVLKQGGLVRVELSGRNAVCSVDRNSPVAVRLRIAFNLIEIMPQIAVLQSGSDKIVMFGSCAQGTDTAESDIDLLVVTRDKINTDKAVRAIKLSRRVQWVIKTPQEYVVMNSKEQVFAGEIRKGIVLWEPYETSRV